MPDPNVNYSDVYSINNDGEVIGVYGEKGDEIGRDGYPIIWKKTFLYRDGIFKDIYFMNNYPKNVINDFGEILAKGSNKSAIYKINEVVELDFWGSDINNKGEVCGKYGYLYRDGEKIDLREFSDGYGVYGIAINDNTQVTGYTYGKYEPHHAYIWDNNEMRIFKGPLSHNTIYDINNKGHIVGSFSGPGTFACMWDKEGNLFPLELLEGTRWSRAYAINDNDQIVGRINAGSQDEEPFLYENGRMRILNDFIPEGSNWIDLSSVTGINNKGQIIGHGSIQDHLHGFAFLMNPISKPKTLSADSNNDGIVNGLDFAEFANQWLMTEDWYYTGPLKW